MPDPEAVRRDLLYLRKGVGYTASRLQRCKAIRAILGTPNDTESVLRERLLSAVSSLRDADAELLRAVYALGDDEHPPTLQQRRDRAGASLGIRREAVADRDAAAIERLLVQLITGWYPKSPIPLRVPESHNGIVQHAVSVTTIVRDRRLLETQHHYRFFATFDGAEYVTMSTAHPEPPVPSGGVSVRTLPATHGHLHQFWFPAPMRRGRTYDLQFRVPGETDDPAWLVEESLAFHEPTRHAEFEVVFLGHRPGIVWSFTGLTAVERPGTPRTGTRLDPGVAARARAEFNDLYGGLFSGVAWDW